MTPEKETPTPKTVEEVVAEFGKQFDELGMKPPKNSMPGMERELLKFYLRTTLTQDRAAIHTSLVAAVEGKKKTLIHSEITLPADHEDVPDELLKRATPHIYNQALDDTLTIINSIFKE